MRVGASEWTPERVRDAEQRQVATGRHVHTALAITPDGEVVGNVLVSVDRSSISDHIGTLSIAIAWLVGPKRVKAGAQGALQRSG